MNAKSKSRGHAPSPFEPLFGEREGSSLGPASGVLVSVMKREMEIKLSDGACDDVKSALLLSRDRFATSLDAALEKYPCERVINKVSDVEHKRQRDCSIDGLLQAFVNAWDSLKRGATFRFSISSRKSFVVVRFHHGHS